MDTKRFDNSLQLILFHLETETFQIVPIPIPDSRLSWCPELARIDDSPVLIDRYPSRGGVEYTMDMWMVKDSYNRGIELSEATWIKHVVNLPGRRWCVDGGDYYFYAGILPTGEMILAQMLDLFVYCYPVPFDVYCYDHIKKKSSLLITIDDANPSCASLYDLADSLTMDACYFEENIIPLSSWRPTVSGGDHSCQ
ncbi:hypothetical protein LIER_44081 [Lithospermum erythrorhizon]|uniref:Uncharacterized protein n=1 Tax=Lithospermum erythrorhizon TaxID=34254 RepID=A0AAV3P714_LITER